MTALELWHTDSCFETVDFFSRNKGKNTINSYGNFYLNFSCLGLGCDRMMDGGRIRQLCIYLSEWTYVGKKHALTNLLLGNANNQLIMWGGVFSHVDSLVISIMKSAIGFFSPAHSNMG